MKNFILCCIVLFISLGGQAQFIPMPLNYPDDGTAYMSWFTSIVDDSNVWVGTVHEGYNGYLPYDQAVRTTDGGESWEFKTIPVTGTPWIQHLAAANANTCYYVYIDGVTYENGIWKTSDGGDSWAKVTTNQFQGGWPNAIHCFTADTVVAVGDPNPAYFEIQITYDGGSTWTRVPQANVPTALSNEWSTQGNFFAAGNTIGFGTSHGRCVHSHDRGLHWEAVQVVDEYMEFCFGDSLHGVGFRPGTAEGYYTTDNGGDTWKFLSNINNYVLASMSSVPGINGAYVITALDTTVSDSLMVFFTTDFFSSFIKIDSNITNASGINFQSPSNGWLGGSYFWHNNIHKYIGVLTSIPEPPLEQGKINIAPNPTRNLSFARIPESWIGKKAGLFIYDLNGRLVRQRNLGMLYGMVTLDATGLPAGVFIVRIETETGESLSQKWVLRR